MYMCDCCSRLAFVPGSLRPRFSAKSTHTHTHTHTHTYIHTYTHTLVTFHPSAAFPAQPKNGHSSAAITKAIATIQHLHIYIHTYIHTYIRAQQRCVWCQMFDNFDARFPTALPPSLPACLAGSSFSFWTTLTYTPFGGRARLMKQQQQPTNQPRQQQRRKPKRKKETNKQTRESHGSPEIALLSNERTGR